MLLGRLRLTLPEGRPPYGEPALQTTRFGGELHDDIEQVRLEGAGASGLLGGDLTGPSEEGEGFGDGLRVSPTRGGEAPDDRRRGASAADDAPQQGMAVLDGERAFSVAHVVGLAGGGDRNAKSAGRLPCSLFCVAREALDAAHLGREAGEGCDLPGVAADDGDLQLREEPLRRLRAQRRGPGAYRVEDHGYAPLVGFTSGEEHGLDLARV